MPKIMLKKLFSKDQLLLLDDFVYLVDDVDDAVSGSDVALHDGRLHTTPIHKPAKDGLETIRRDGFEPRGDGFVPRADGIEPRGDGFEPR